jgi:predicted transposase YdaD
MLVLAMEFSRDERAGHEAQRMQGEEDGTAVRRRSHSLKTEQRIARLLRGAVREVRAPTTRRSDTIAKPVIN